MRDVSDAKIRELSLEQKYRAQIGTPIRRLIGDCFALVVEASRRHVEQIHYDVQLLCGIQMALGKIAEMKTGEGKTLTSSLVTYLLGLRGHGVHAVTFNDYLAKRDCEFLRPVYEALGLSVSVIEGQMPNDEKKRAYACDITYGSAKEFGFDFLRDRMANANSGTSKNGVMRGTHFAVVDEADSILIDEARTPLIIGMVNKSEENVVQQCYRWAAEHAEEFSEHTDYKYDELRKTVKLNSNGIQKLRSLPQNNGTVHVSIRELYDHIQNSIKVRRDFQLDKHYAVIDDKIVILDEFTGRPAEGRQWQRGIHQAVEAKEEVDISAATQSAATITIQSFFLKYDFFCGMTGTAWTSRREFGKVYKKKIAKIPTHRKTRRKQLGTKVFTNQSAKFDYICDASEKLATRGRAILIGTRSVEKSELLSRMLREKGVEHDVLNARYLEREADLVAQAGQPGRVTVATNMAGRGTDIKLHESVKAAGGLHVFLTELHESQRIDWQLIGRASRQGAPGSYQICVSLDDEILRVGLGVSNAEKLFKRMASKNALNSRQLISLFRKAQRKTERKHLVDRLMVMKQDEERKKSSFDTGQDPYLTTVM